MGAVTFVPFPCSEMYDKKFPSQLDNALTPTLVVVQEIETNKTPEVLITPPGRQTNRANPECQPEHLHTFGFAPSNQEAKPCHEKISRLSVTSLRMTPAFRSERFSRAITCRAFCKMRAMNIDTASIVRSSRFGLGFLRL